MVTIKLGGSIQSWREEKTVFHFSKNHWTSDSGDSLLVESQGWSNNSIESILTLEEDRQCQFWYEIMLLIISLTILIYCIYNKLA